MTRVISQSTLLEATAHWLDAGWRVGGPQRVQSDLVQYDWLTTAKDLLLDGFVRPANSIKSFFLPRYERLFAYQGQGRQVELVPLSPPDQPQVVLAARPCDAAALPILDRVFNWDFRDAFFNHRRQLSTVVTVACQQHDAHCFCTSVGLQPDSVRGSDVLLLPLDDDQFEVRCVTEKGRQLVGEWTSESDRVGQVGEGPKKRFDLSAVRLALADGVDDARWATMALSCLGCGACAHSCPACYCFDIVDQHTHGGGSRARNWDSCQAVVYSKHASGHNPRSNQAARQRNRINHKYKTYPEKFGEILCTGCGACGRTCAVGLGVRNVLQQLAGGDQSQLASPSGRGTDQQPAVKGSVR